MIIDIDIKIADDSGKVIHRFAKQFDERMGSEQNYNVRNGIKKEFQDFLNEYLSASGHTIRERLISSTRDFSSPGFIPYEKVGNKEYDALRNGLEYNISIGNRSVFVGKIPIDRVRRIERVQEVINSEEQRQRDATAENAQQSLTSLKGGASVPIREISSEKRTVFESKHKTTDSKEQQIKSLQTAVTKYEASFCVEETKSSNFEVENAAELSEEKEK